MALTYYEVLGVPENASDTEIEAAFGNKAREVHPDKVAPGSPYLRKVAGEAFKDLSEAKSVLLNRGERQKYDAELAYLRGSATSSNSPSSQTPYQASPPPPPAPAPTPQPAQKYSFWKPANTSFGSVALVVGGLGCLLLLGGIAGTDKSAYLGLTFALLSLALLSWRHGVRPGTDPKVLGGSVFLFIFAAMALAAWVESPSFAPKPPVEAKTGVQLQQMQVAVPPDIVPCKTVDAKTCVGTVGTSGSVSSVAVAQTSKRSGSRPVVEKDPILAAIKGSSASKTEASNGEGADHTESENRNEVAAHYVTRTWKNLNDGQSYRTRLNRELLSVESVDAYPKATGDLVSCDFHRALSVGVSWTGGCWERNRKDQSTYRSVATVTIFSDTRIEGSTNYTTRFVMIPVEGAAKEGTENSSNSEGRSFATSQPEVRTSSEIRPPSVSGSSPHRLDRSNLTVPEQQSIESACSQAKYLEGPASYNRCLENQLSLLGAGSRRPDLSGLSLPEQQSIESACSQAKYLEGPASYNRCLQNQLALLGAGSRRPDLSGLSVPERQSIESACSQAKYLEGPASYNRCLQNQLSLLGAGSRRPDLSGLSVPEQQSIESACSQAKYLEGPAAYNRCLLRQMDLLKNNR